MTFEISCPKSTEPVADVIIGLNFILLTKQNDTSV